MENVVELEGILKLFQNVEGRQFKGTLRQTLIQVGMATQRRLPNIRYTVQYHKNVKTFLFNEYSV